MTEQRGQFLIMPPPRLQVVELPPGIERAFRVQAACTVKSVLDDAQHLSHFFVQRPGRILGKPFGRQTIRRNADAGLAVDFHAQTKKGMGRARHRGDAVLERHARPQAGQMEVAILNVDFHGNWWGFSRVFIARRTAPSAGSCTSVTGCD